MRTDYYVWQCFGGDNASWGFTWLAIIYIYLAILQLVGIVLAFQTRKVKVKVLNDAKFITAIIYISSLVFVLLIAVTFLLGAYINVTEVLFSGGILVAITALVALIFIPKVRYTSACYR